MPFDQPTRNLLQRTVSRCRDILAGRWDSPADGEFFKQLQEIYGISPDGTAAPLEVLEHLSDEDLETARVLREILDHYTSGLVATGKKPAEARREAVLRLAREQAFTVLNRLAALRMAEERGIVLECVRQGLQSEGFQLFQQSAGTALGSTPAAYRTYLFVLFDELSRDLGVLFNRFDKSSLLFPRHAALEAILRELNGTGSANKDAAFTPAQISTLWAEDEAIGWIYQYYNDESERKKMRDESSAPRNSRELAVRNQFFTPRYVVEFLTDNTLGRIWYEMTKGRTKLKEQCKYLVRRPTEIFLGPEESAPEVSSVQSSVFSKEAPETSKLKTENYSQEELLRQTVFVPHRPLKDPRDIRLLDPACGSMHFGLYAFDLFEAIYEEFWDMVQRLKDEGRSMKELEAAHPEFSSFILHTSSFQTKEEFLRSIPRLIIENNLHGIDIDPRATQIAGLSLWLRAQKSWQKLGVPMAERPQVRRSNLVCAEPMPGEKEMLREFVEQQFPAAERPAFAFLLEKIFDRMALAGEAGSLLRIEEEIRSAIAEARALAQSQSTLKQGQFFAEHKKPEQSEFDLRGLNDEQFWQAAEQRIYDALEAYAEQAERGGGFQRRLFADDAAQGFAFIDLCRKRYEVVVMNPPFGLPTDGLKQMLQSAYDGYWTDIYASFVKRASDFVRPVGGGIGAITSRTFVHSKQLTPLRELFSMPATRLNILLDLGMGVLDAAVETAAWFTGSSSPSAVTFRDWTKIDKSELSLKASSFLQQSTGSSQVFLRTLESFDVLPFRIFGYWFPESVINTIKSFDPFEPNHGQTIVGMKTFDDFRFIRLPWEPNYESKAANAFLYTSKGGGWSRYHTESIMCIDWRRDGEPMRANEIAQYQTDARTRQSCSYWFKPGLIFSEVSSLGFSVQPQALGSLFGGSGFFIHLGSFGERWGWLAFFNSRPVLLILSLLSTDRHWNSGMVGSLPVPANGIPEALDKLGRKAFKLAQADGSQSETSFDFVSASSLHPLDTNRVDGEIQAAIDNIVTSSLRIPKNDLDFLEAHFGIPEHRSETRPQPARDFYLSYLTGVCFGRWDIRYATGERPAPELPDPFDPLPVCPPGMLQGDNGLPLSPEAGRKLRAEGHYPIDVVWDGILVDDPEHPLDLERQVRAVLTVLWADRADALEHEACALLGVSSLRDYFRRPSGFFADHLKRYSKSRRQAPIYWPLSTASGSYTLWIYYHRLTPDTLYKCLQQFVEPKIREVETNLTRLRAMDDAGEGGRQTRDQLAKAETLRTELLAFRDELAHWAPRWKPNLNDGVQITASPLWKLFLLPKWRKTLEQTWKELDRGDYDWAHLAHTLHPARVREKCKTDRSLAIAHSLEDLCEIQPPAPKKKRGKKAKDEEELI